MGRAQSIDQAADLGRRKPRKQLFGGAYVHGDGTLSPPGVVDAHIYPKSCEKPVSCAQPRPRAGEPDDSGKYSRLRRSAKALYAISSE